MRNKINALLILLLILLTGLMAAVAYKAREKSLEDVLLITPGNPVETPADIEKLEDRNEADYILTYDIGKAGTMTVLNIGTDVVIRGTNYLYAGIMRTPIISGAFFTKAAQEESRKLAVLNEKAAFDILGGMETAGSEIKLDGETFTVCGVIRDGDKDNNNVYIPLGTGFSAASPDTFAAFIDSGIETAREEIINKMKSFSIDENVYDFYSLSDFTRAIYSKMLLSVKSAALVLLVLLFITCFSGVRRRFGVIGALNKDYETRDVLRIGWREVTGAALGSCWLAISVVLMLLTLLSGIEDLLFIVNAEIVMTSGYASGFSFVINFINKLSVYAHFAFLGFVVILLAFFISNLFKTFYNPLPPG